MEGSDTSSRIERSLSGEECVCVWEREREREREKVSFKNFAPDISDVTHSSISAFLFALQATAELG